MLTFTISVIQDDLVKEVLCHVAFQTLFIGVWIKN